MSRLLVLLAVVAAARAATPEPLSWMPLWEDRPPQMIENAPPEQIGANGRFENVSVPAISVFLPPKEKSTGRALLVCPGGSYRVLDWNTHVIETARYFNERGVAVIGLKYRTSPPNQITKTDRGIPLADLKRAVRLVRHHAADWNLDPHQIGVLGFSAGANLAVTLASAFDEGDARAADPVERLSCRPDFVIACSTWHWGDKTSPFTFPQNTPPVFLVHASDDRIAPLELPLAIKGQLETLGLPVHLEVYPEGGHAVAHLVPRRVEQNFPATKWPEALATFLGRQP